MLGEKFRCEDCDEERSMRAFVGNCNDKTCIRRNLCEDCAVECEGCGLEFCSHHASNVAAEDKEDRFLCLRCQEVA